MTVPFQASAVSFLAVDRTVEFSRVTVLEDGMQANREVEVPGPLLPHGAQLL